MNTSSIKSNDSGARMPKYQMISNSNSNVCWVWGDLYLFVLCNKLKKKRKEFNKTIFWRHICTAKIDWNAEMCFWRDRLHVSIKSTKCYLFPFSFVLVSIANRYSENGCNANSSINQIALLIRTLLVVAFPEAVDLFAVQCITLSGVIRLALA